MTAADMVLWLRILASAAFAVRVGIIGHCAASAFMWRFYGIFKHCEKLAAWQQQGQFLVIFENREKLAALLQRMPKKFNF